MNTRKLSAILMALAVLFTLLGVPVLAIPQPSEEFYVCDEANVIEKSTESHIKEQNDKLFYSTGAQIVIATVETTDGESIRDFAGEMFTAWGIGDKEKNNGVLVLLAIADEDYWVTQGSGIEEELSAGDIKVMLDNLLEPSFAAGDYDKGVLSLFDRLISTFEGIYDVDLAEVVLPEGGIDHTGKVQAKAGGGIGSAILTELVIVVVIVLFIIIVMTVVRGINGSSPRGYRRPNVHIPPGGRRPPARRPGGMGIGHRPGNRPGGPGMGGPGMGPRPGGRPSGMGGRPGGGAGRSMGGRPSGGARPRSGGGGGTRGGGAGRR